MADRVVSIARDAGRPVLIRGSTIVSMAVNMPPVFTGDLLIKGSVIAYVGPQIETIDAEIIDGAGRILIPGLVNAHLHSWQTGLRGACADWAIGDYLRIMHEQIGPRFAPEDIRLATLAGALNQIASGTTTLGDWCHNNPTPDHSAAAIEGLKQSGIRARFLHGAPKPQPAPGRSHFSEIAHSRAEIERLAGGMLADRGGLVTLGMAILGPHFSTPAVACADLQLARDMDLLASMHQGGGPPVYPDAWAVVEAAGLAGPNINLVHANKLADDRMQRLLDAGASFTCTPEVELSMGHGAPIMDRLIRMGGLPSLGVDVESVVSGEMLTVARFALVQQRASAHAAGASSHLARSLDALRWATLGGAQALGLADRTGSLEQGKQADLVMIDTRALNLTPVHDPIATALQAGLVNIEAVMIGGRWQKRAGKLLYPALDQLLADLDASGRHILAETKADGAQAIAPALAD